MFAGPVLGMADVHGGKELNKNDIKHNIWDWKICLNSI